MKKRILSLILVLVMTIGFVPLVTAAEIKDTSKIFTDIKAKAWYKEYVDYSVAYGIFTGTGNNKFSPNANITRAQFVQVLANIQGVDTSNRKVTTKFSDVPSGKWFTAAVKWASENGVVNGTGNGKFDPNANVTREQMCVMLVNYAKFKRITLKTVESKASFEDDNKISKWAKTAVYTCQQADIVNGKGAGKFDPQGTGTRAEASVMFTKFHKDYTAESGIILNIPSESKTYTAQKRLISHGNVYDYEHTYKISDINYTVKDTGISSYKPFEVTVSFKVVFVRGSVLYDNKTEPLATTGMTMGYSWVHLIDNSGDIILCSDIMNDENKERTQYIAEGNEVEMSVTFETLDAGTYTLGFLEGNYEDYQSRW